MWLSIDAREDRVIRSCPWTRFGLVPRFGAIARQQEELSGGTPRLEVLVRAACFASG